MGTFAKVTCMKEKKNDCKNFLLLPFFSCVNPILYAFLSDNFRKAFHLLMPCFVNMNGPTHPGHHALRYELTTLKSSTRLRGSREERRRRPQKFRKGSDKVLTSEALDTVHRSNEDSRKDM